MRARWASSSRFERVLAARYPFGVSRRQQLKSVVPVAADISSVKVLFVASVSDCTGAQDNFSGAQGELLLKAAVHGLGWKREEIELLFVHQNTMARDSTTRENKVPERDLIRQEIATLQPSFVVALGREVHAVLDIASHPLSLASEGRCTEREGICFLATADLDQVTSKAEVKRIFWNDLKNLSTRVTQ